MFVPDSTRQRARSERALSAVERRTRTLIRDPLHASPPPEQQRTPFHIRDSGDETERICNVTIASSSSSYDIWHYTFFCLFVWLINWLTAIILRRERQRTQLQGWRYSERSTTALAKWTESRHWRWAAVLSDPSVDFAFSSLYQSASLITHRVFLRSHRFTSSQVIHSQRRRWWLIQSIRLQLLEYWLQATFWIDNATILSVLYYTVKWLDVFRHTRRMSLLPLLISFCVYVSSPVSHFTYRLCTYVRYFP